MTVIAPAALVFPHPEPPPFGALTEIAPGVLWLRLSLPFLLDHVNVYLIEDGAGWALLDTGIGDAATRAVWEALLAGPLRSRKLTRIIATHFHPDHMGLVGWLTHRFDLPLAMSQTEFLFTQTLRGNPEAVRSPQHQAFYRQRGLDEAALADVVGRGHAYLALTTGTPPVYQRLVAGEILHIGGRSFEVLTGGGHSPEQVMLLCRDDALFFAADQVLARISPNISVWAWEPEANPLDAYLRSLADLRTILPQDALVLAAHNLPFIGLHQRAEELAHHHAERCAAIAAACAKTPMTAAEIVPVLFRRKLDSHATGFAFGEVVAHLNFMRGRNELVVEADSAGVQRVRSLA